MDALLLVLVAGACLLFAYLTYARWLSRRVFALREDAVTPATEFEDNADYVPTKKSIIFGHHFTSIAGTGPIVGPAIAVMWGWLPAILWVVLGSIFVGAVHDLGSLVVSLRNKGHSIGDIAGDLLGPRARFIFLLILIMGLWIVLAIFGLVVAAVLRQYPGAIFPVVIQIPIALVIGLLIHRKGKSIVIPSIVALAIMYASVVWGDAGILHEFNTAMASLPTWAWVAGLLLYAYIASVLPVWTLLQPRDYINALQLITSLGILVAGLLVAATLGGAPDDTPVIDTTKQVSGTPPSPPEVGEGGSIASSIEPGEGVPPDSSPTPSPSTRPELNIVAPMVDWQPIGAPPMLPVLFITIACGACSGFHCLVGSGTTSKQIRRETDATAVGYGSMVTEGFLATLVIAACVAGLGLGASHELRYGTTFFPQAFASTPADPTSYERRGFHNVPISDASTANDEDGYYAVYSRKDRIDLTQTTQLEQGSAPPLERPEVLSLQIFRHEKNVIRTGTRDTMLGVPRFIYQEEGKDERSDPIDRFEGELATHWYPLADGKIRISDDHRAALVSGPPAFSVTYASWQEAGSLGAKVGAFVQGAANLIASTGIPHPVGLALMGVLVASFAGTTMDTACRLQRYVVQELSRTFLPKKKPTDCHACGYDLSAHKHTESDAPAHCPECGEPFHPSRATTGVAIDRASFFNPFRWLVTTHGATTFAIITAFALAMTPAPGTTFSLATAGTGGLILWPLFGATNQLLGGFAFIVITAWLLATRKPVWFIALPAIFMLAVPASAMTWQAFLGNENNPSWVAQSNWLLVTIACITLALEAWLIIETLAHWVTQRPFGALHDAHESDA